jgi:site-specific recombinase XerD
MATLRKRKNKKGFVYLVDFYFNGKKFIRSTKTDDLTTAKLILKDLQAKIAKNQFKIDDIKPKKKVYLKNFIPEFLDYSLKHKAPKTFIADKAILKNFMSFAGDRTLDSVNEKLIDKYITHRLETVKKSSVNIELRHLKSAFSKAQNWGCIERNPFKGIKLLTAPENKPRFFNQEQINELLSVIDKQWFKEIFVFAIHTGLRRGEIVNLKWRDVDFDNSTIKVSQDSDFTTKSKKERIVPINNTVFNLLISMKRNSEYVFANESGNKTDDGKVSKQFKYYLANAELDNTYTFHSCRHTFASHLVQKGVSLYIVSKLLGHSDVKTTEIYAHLSPQTFQDVVRLLDEKEMGIEVRS